MCVVRSRYECNLLAALCPDAREAEHPDLVAAPEIDAAGFGGNVRSVQTFWPYRGPVARP